MTGTDSVEEEIGCEVLEKGVTSIFSAAHKHGSASRQRQQQYTFRQHLKSLQFISEEKITANQLQF